MLSATAGLEASGERGAYRIRLFIQSQTREFLWGILIREIDHYIIYFGTVSEHDALNREYVRIECY